ncbi:hypothetical protein NBRC116592_36770 [Colwellia sp. KU-HH00111]|uniref:glycosyltransferase family 2 protein n=1 Tax=Colwellia sp. KU-HH00111 TaxID=3127652 RepID=UPI0031048D6E
MPKLSIIVPVFNTESYLGECLDSLLNQTLLDIEIIVVNDCSPGNCSEIVNEKKQTDNRLRLIENKINLGTFHTRKAGVLCAEGEFITFVDSDDSLKSEACSMIYNALMSSGADIAHIACSRFEGVNFKHIPFSDEADEHAFRPQAGLVTADKWREQLIEYDIDNCVWSYAVRKELYFKAYSKLEFCPRLLMLEDFLLMFTVSGENVNNCIYLEERLYNYRIDASGITQSIGNTDKLIAMISDISYSLITSEKILSKSQYYTQEMLLRFKNRMIHDFEWYAKQFFKLPDEQKALAIERLDKKNTATIWLNLIARLGEKYSNNKYLIFDYLPTKEKLKVIIKFFLGR